MAELARLQHRFEELAEELVEKPGYADRAQAMGRLLNYARQCIATSLKAREQEDLIARLEALEEALEQAKPGGSRWRA